MMALATVTLGCTAFTLASGGKLSLPIAGTGVICLTSTLMLLAAGALGELIYKLGDLREHQFSRLTQHLLVSGRSQ
jgi:hypothetical protein